MSAFAPIADTQAALDLAQWDERDGRTPSLPFDAMERHNRLSHLRQNIAIDIGFLINRQPFCGR